MFVKNKRKLVVDCYPPGKVRLLWLGILLLLAGLAWVIWGYTPAQLAAQRAHGEQQRFALLQRLAAVEQERAGFKAEIGRLRAMKGVDEGAYRLLRQNYDALQLRVLEMQEQLAFYEAVVGPDQEDEALKIQRFRIEPDGEGYRYSLVVVRSKKGEGTVTGDLRLSIQGADGGGDRTLDMRKVTDPAVEGQKLGFRYFQNVSGRLRLPDGFVPRRIRLKLDLRSPGRDIDKSYSWAQLQG